MTLVSGAVSLLTTEPALHRRIDLPQYPHLLARLQVLSAAGYTDQEIATRLSAEGFRSPRRRDFSAKGVETLRRAQHLVSLREQLRRQETVDGRWTVSGLARAVGGTVPADRHPVTGRYLIAAPPNLIAQLQEARGARDHR
jgi:hypothetical protein